MVRNIFRRQQQTSQTDDYLLQKVDLSGYVGQSIKIRFRAIRGAHWDGDIAIDDIFVTTENDVAMAAITHPRAGIDACGSEVIVPEISIVNSVVKVNEVQFRTATKTDTMKQLKDIFNKTETLDNLD